MDGRTSTTTTTQKLSPEQKQLLGLVVPAAKDISTNTPQLFPGSTIAPFTALQQAGQAGAVNTAVNFLDPFIGSTAAAHTNLQNSAIPQGTAGLGNLIGGMNTAAPARDFLLSGAAMSPQSNPYLAGTAQAAISPIYDKLMQQILPGIRQGAQQAGQVGSSRQGIAESNAINNFANTAGNMTASIYSQGYGQGLDSMTGTVKNTTAQAGSAAASLLNQGTRSLFAAPSIANLSLMPSKILDAVGNAQQQQQQTLLTEQANNYMTQQLMPWLIAKDVGNLAFGMPGGSTVSKAKTPPPNPLEVLLGLGSTFAGFM